MHDSAFWHHYFLPSYTISISDYLSFLFPVHLTNEINSRWASITGEFLKTINSYVQSTEGITEEHLVQAEDKS